MSAVSGPAGAVSVRRRRSGRRLVEASDLLVWAILAVLVVVNAAMQPTFLTEANVYFIFSSTLVLVFAAAAVTLVMLIAEIDLAIGAILSLVNVLIATLAPSSALLGVLLAVGTGVGCSLVAGGLVAFVRLPSIIVTLALATVWGGVALSIQSRPGGVVPPQFASMMLGSFPLVATLVLALGGVWFSRTGVGRRIFGLGSDELGAMLSGIPLARTKLAAFGVAGVLLGLAGVGLSGITDAGDPLSGSPYTLTAITAAVLGGVAFSGGRGTILGAIGGALVLTLITNIVQLSGASSFYQGIVNGGLLISSLALSRAATGRWVPIGPRRDRKEGRDHVA